MPLLVPVPALRLVSCSSWFSKTVAPARYQSVAKRHRSEHYGLGCVQLPAVVRRDSALRVGQVLYGSRLDGQALFVCHDTNI